MNKKQHDDKYTQKVMEIRQYEKLSSNFLKTCYNGNPETIKNLLRSKEMKDKIDKVCDLKIGLVCACSIGNIDAIEYLLESEELKSQRNKIDYNDLLINAAKNGHLNIIRYFLISPKFENKININADNDLFKTCCIAGNVEVVRYLLTSPDLKEHIDLTRFQDEEVLWAIISCKVELLNYLTSSPELIRNSNINNVVDRVLYTARYNKNPEMVKSLIFDYNIPKPNIDMPKYILEMFNKRNLKQQLESNLTDNKDIKKIKI